MKCSEPGCNNEASFQIPFHKLNGKKLIVEFYEYRCKQHMIYNKTEQRKWSKSIREKKKQ